jgi:hypothetical protein
MSPEELKFFAEVALLLNPVITSDIEYRLHYNVLGEIISCSMIEHPDNTQYLVVTKEEYDTYFQYRVVDNKLKKIDRDAGYRVKLQKSVGGCCVVKDHASLVLEPNETYITTEYYDHRNN